MTGRMPKFLAATAPIALASLAMAGAAPAFAQDSTAAAQQQRAFSIPAARLSQSVLALSEQAGVQVVFDSDTTSNVAGNAVSGNLTLTEALNRLLSGTGLSWRWLRTGVVTIESANAGGERVTGAVRVEGLQGSPYFGGAGVAAGVNGVNGSRDITATEGTKSFTSGALTIGSKVPQAMKDVPQSLSVLTAERMEQQNVTDFATALKQLPGITLVQGESSLQTSFYSRGFPIRSIQVDGGAPLIMGSQNVTDFSFHPQIDMSQYDHVELLRGSAGLLNGYGDPSGTVNLVRKKPLDHAQFTLEAQVGSWNNYRVVADGTSPLALDGRLRGRLVIAYQDNEYFYDTAKDNKTSIYGIAELDLTPTTLVTAGISHTRQDSVPWMNGLPRYLNGEDLKLPRSTSIMFPWNRWDFDTTEIFGGIEQKLGDDWTAKLNVTHNSQASTRKVGYSEGAVNPTNGLGAQLKGSYADFASKQLSTEIVLSGAFSLFGQRQEVTLGVNRVDSDGGGGKVNYGSLVNTILTPYQPYPGGPVYCQDFGLPGYCPPGRIPSNPPIDIFNFDPTDALFTEPGNPLATLHFQENGQVQTGAYINLRFTPVDRLHLTTGLRWSRYKRNLTADYLCTPSLASLCAGKEIGDPWFTASFPYRDKSFSWPPAANLSFDVTRALTVYLGYTDIYESQAYYLDSEHNPLPPVTGANWEGGIKWAPKDGRLNLSLAAYRLQKKNQGSFDPSHPYEQVRPDVYCCYVVDPNRIYESKGIDFEVTGELRPGWQIAASYVFNENEFKGSSLSSLAGTPLISIQPKHLYKLWMGYDFAAAGHRGALSGLVVAGGVNGQSSAYQSGSTCVRLDDTVPPNPLTGSQPCAPGGFEDYKFTVPAYALLSGRIDYRFSKIWSLAVNLENLLDKTYYQTTGYSVTGGHWYGAPRSFTATLRAKW